MAEIEAPGEGGGLVAGVVELVLGVGCGQGGEGVGAVAGDEDEVVAQGGPGGFVGDAGFEGFGMGLDGGDGPGAEEVFCGGGDAVGVGGDGVGEQSGGVVVVGVLGGCRAGGVVAGEDLFEQVGGCGRRGGVGLGEQRWVAVAGGLQPQVVGVLAAGKHGVELLA